MKKSRFLEKILHSKSLRMINGASRITKSSRENHREQKLLRGRDLEEARGQVREAFCVPGADPRDF